MGRGEVIRVGEGGRELVGGEPREPRGKCILHTCSRSAKDRVPENFSAGCLRKDEALIGREVGSSEAVVVP